MGRLLSALSVRCLPLVVAALVVGGPLPATQAQTRGGAGSFAAATRSAGPRLGAMSQAQFAAMMQVRLNLSTLTFGGDS
jgi:hypothetical protein